MAEIILWRRIDMPGHEIAKLESREGGWALSGTTVFLHKSDPCRLDYQVACDGRWRTLSALVRGIVGQNAVELNIAVDDTQRWSLNGTECTAVAGCVDVDLGFSPSTNLLPIRRLSLAVGEKAVVSAAWLPFPELTLQPLHQVYRRNGASTYRYESGGGSFVRTLSVNEAGFVRDYPGLWIEESTGSTPLVP